MRGDEADRVIDLYARHAAAWAAERRFNNWERRWIDRFCEEMRDGGHVLDLGCGSGAPMGAELLARGCRVTGVDAAAGMIAIAAAQPGTWIKADMRRLDLGQRFDGILAWFAMFHLSPEDQRGMFAVLEAHAKPGAVVIITTGPGAGVSIGNYQGEPLYHASLAEAEYRDLFAGHGFEVVAHVAEDAASGGATIWVARMRETVDG